MEHANEDDWQEEVYQKIKAMKEMYLPELNEMYQKIAAKLQQVSKENILPGFKEKLGSYEKQIINFINTNRPRKLGPSLQQGQLPPPQGPPPPSQMHSMQQPQSQITQVQSHENQMNPQLQSMNLQGSLATMQQMEHANEDDWKEKVFQKIKAMKEMYLPELNEMYQKMAAKLQQHDSLPQQPKSEQLEKLKVFKTMLERIITFLQVSKESVLPGFKEKLGSYEKQIMNFINTNRPGKAVPSLQQGQLPQPQGPPPPSQMHSMQQPQSQITQLQSHENQMKMNLQSSVATMQQTEHANEDYWQEEVFEKPKKGKSFKKKGKGKKKPLKAKGGVQKPTTNQQDKGSCFHCGIPEHWKRNCKVYLASLKDKPSEGADKK